MHFVLDHVLEALVVRRSEEDHDLHLLAGKPVVHHFIATKLVAKTVQLFRNLVNSTSLVW